MSNRERTGLIRVGRILGVLGALCAVLMFWNCNLSEGQVEKIINIKLDDSLAYESGFYDTIRVDILEADGAMFKEKAFHGRYRRNPEGKLSINLGKDAPDRFDILIIAYRNGEEVLKLKISVSGSAVVDKDTLIGPSDPGPRVQVTPNPGSLTLVAGGAGEKVTAKVTPDSLPQDVIWSSANADIASVDGTGLVTPLTEGQTEIIVRAAADTSKTARIPVLVGKPGVRKVDSIRLSPNQLLLYVGGTPGQLAAQVFPTDLSLGPVFSSSEEGLVRVTADGKVTAVAPGEAYIRVRPQGLSAPMDSCLVMVRIDPPVLEVGGDRQAKAGEEVVFQIRVAQAHGGVAMLKWDLDGDGRWDADSVRDSVASPRKTYSAADKEVRISFYARDTEGNQDSVQRRVVVDSKAPFVNIIRPSGQDTLVNNSPFTVEYEVGGIRKTKQVKLVEGVNPVVIIETDAGGTGRDSVDIILDSTPPAPPNWVTQPPSVVNSADTRTSLEWSWTRGETASDSFIVRLNGSVVARQTATTFAVGNLTDGNYALQIVELDLAGNVSTPISAVLVTVDRTPPPAPTPSATSPTRDSTPTWTWTPSESGTFEYRLERDVAPAGAGIALSAPVFTPSPALQDGAWQFQVRERDPAGNWSPWSAISTVVLNVTAPIAPTVSRNSAAANTPRWSWVGGGGGNGTFRFRWAGAATYLSEGRASEYSPANLPEQAHSLCVAERDTVGYGTEACAVIMVDRTPPSISGIDVPEGFITNRSPILIRFIRDGSADTLSCDLTDGASKVCQRVLTDAAGNSATISRTVWYRSNVVFVKAGGAGTKTGSSWADAFGDIGTALMAIDSRAGQLEVWVTEGTYPNFNLARSNTSILGGFSVTGAPTTNDARDPFARVSRIRADSNGSTIKFPSDPLRICRNVLIDGFHIFEEIGQALGIFNVENTTFRNLWIERNRNESGGAGLIAVAYSSVTFDKLFIRDNSSIGYGAIYLYSGGSMTMSNSEISNNRTESSWGSAGILSDYGGNIILRTTRLNLNSGGSRQGDFGPYYQIYNHGVSVLDIDQCVVEGLRAGAYPPDAAPNVIWGNQNSEP